MAVVSPVAAGLADRLPRKTVLVGADVVRALLVAVATAMLFAGAPTLAILAVPAVAIMLARTPFGLHIRAVGSDPKAAAAAGISRNRVQLHALTLSGVLGGAAGAYLSMGYVSWFASNMTAGHGFIAIAVEVMGMGSAWGALAASLILAVAETAAITMQSLGLPHELMQMIPYVVPIVVLTVYVSRRRARQLV